MVTGIRLETIDETSVRISWNRIPLDEITNYTVYYRPVGSRKRQAGEMTVVVPSSRDYVEIQNLETETRYQFQVEATALLEDGTRLTGQRSPVVRQDTTNPTPTEGNNIQRTLHTAISTCLFYIFSGVQYLLMTPFQFLFPPFKVALIIFHNRPKLWKRLVHSCGCFNPLDHHHKYYHYACGALCVFKEKVSTVM